MQHYKYDFICNIIQSYNTCVVKLYYEQVMMSSPDIDTMLTVIIQINKSYICVILFVYIFKDEDFDSSDEFVDPILNIRHPSVPINQLKRERVNGFFLQ